MPGEKDLPLRENPGGDRPGYKEFIEMHKQFAALELRKKEEREKNEPPRTPPRLGSPIEFANEKKGYDFKERYKNVAKTLRSRKTAEARAVSIARLRKIIVGFQDNSVSLPYFKLAIADEILERVQIDDEEKDKKIVPCLANMPKEVIKGILCELYPQWQVCFALSCKRIMKISKEINQDWGVVYGRAAKFHVLWRLEDWMGQRKLCMACEKYYPVSTQYWKDRKEDGPCKTASKIYGRRYADFEFCEGICPECSANRRWRSVCKASSKLQTSPFS